MTPALSKQSLIFKQSLILTTISLALTRLSYCSIAKGNVDSNIPLIANYFGTKGRYEDVNPYLRDNILAVNTSSPPSSDCSAIHLTAIIRHGTRYPTTPNIKKIHRLYDLVVNEASSTEKWLEHIQTEWKMWYTEDMDGKLVQKGRDDHRHLAIRLATMFPSLVSEENLRGGRIKFTTSSKHRCVDSIEAFQVGLLNLWKVKDVGHLHEIDDELMRFFDKCQRFVEGVENNPSALMEVKLFKASAAMQKVQRKMADRLRAPYDLVTPAMVEAAFFLCSYEFAIKSLHSPWCQLFDEEDALVLEYKNDLKQYWKRGYGHDINRKSSCTLFHDLFNRLDLISHQHRSGQVSEAVTVQVGHGETLLPLLSLLGFFRDATPLTAANFLSQGERAFRTSRIVPYAANLQFVLYACGEGPRLQVLLNERPVTFPGMKEAAPLYREVRERYGALLQGCDFHRECGVSPSRHTEPHHPPSHDSEL